MAVRIRLKRVGATHRPYYRIVVADSKSPRDGRFIENVGTYDPLPNPSVVNVKEDRLRYWLSVGAMPSEGAQQVLRTAGFVDAKGKAVPKPEGVTETPEG